VSAHFIEGDNGWINLDHVAEVRSMRSGPLVFLKEDGAELGRMTRHHGVNLEELTAPIIPAAHDAARDFIWSPSLGRFQNKGYVLRTNSGQCHQTKHLSRCNRLDLLLGEIGKCRSFDLLLDTFSLNSGSILAAWGPPIRPASATGA
jgi:hypothetical protein